MVEYFHVFIKVEEVYMNMQIVKSQDTLQDGGAHWQKRAQL